VAIRLLEPHRSGAAPFTVDGAPLPVRSP